MIDNSIHFQDKLPRKTDHGRHHITITHTMVVMGFASVFP